MRRVRPAPGLPLAALLIAVAASSGCGGARATPCMRHSQCATGDACVLGACVDGSLDAAFSAADFSPEPWFSRDGSCVTDDECGPWACDADAGRCVTPEGAGRAPLTRGDLAYWDGSCAVDADCGPYVCAQGWCHDPAYVGLDAVGTGTLSVLSSEGNFDTIFGESEGIGGLSTAGAGGGLGGPTCLGDGDCGVDGECITPGYCVFGRGAEPFDYAELWDRVEVYGAGSGACAVDGDCGPWLCDGGACRSPTDLGHTPPLRSELEFWDASCSSDADCGPWSCPDGMCRPYWGVEQ